MFLNGEAIQGRGTRGQRVVDDSFMMLMNANDEGVDWKLPTGLADEWEVVVDTAGDTRPGTTISSGSLLLPTRSTFVLRVSS